MVEFALVAVFLFIPLFIGTIFAAIGLARAIQAESVGRDAANMYSRSVDFTLASNRAVLARLGAGIDLQTTNSGSSVVLLTTLTYVNDTDCAAAGLSTAACSNRNMVVVTARQVMGNTSVGTSKVATPNAGIVQSTGGITATNYLTNTSVRAPLFGGPGCTSCLAPINRGEQVWIAEVFVSPSNFTMPGYSNAGIYSRVII